MMYLLDSNICIYYMRKGKESKLIDTKLLQHKKDDIRLSAIVVAELLHGAYHSKRVEQNLRETLDFIADFEVIAFDEPEANAYGQILDSLQRKGQIIGNNDILIAATALIRNATLVTNNIHEFSRIDGLKLDDWTL